MIYRLVIAIFVGVLIASCNSSRRINKEFNYFQRGLDSLGATTLKDPVIQPNDLLSIQVFSKGLNQEQALLFNLPNQPAVNTSGQQTSIANFGYLVDMAGNIEVPLIGKVKASGFTRNQLNDSLVVRVAPFVKDPGVIVRFLQFRVNVLGEVKNPGTHNFQTDRVTIVDALGAAGDLNDNAKREDILVIREEGDKRKYYNVDIRSGALFQSPVYQLQQNDLVYVGANINKLKIVNTNPNVQRDIQLGLSIASGVALLISIINIIKK